MATADQELPFIRNLASSDKRLRSQALTSLQTFLTAQRALDRLTALKLWKGLFFALWMCDKPIPQQNLCAELADLYTSLPAHRKKDKRNDNGTEATGGGGLVSIWFAAAWEVLATHWTEIDVLRMDKFLLLTRRVFAAQLRWVRDAAWDEGRQGSVVDVLKAWPFESEGDVARVPLGLRLHALDIWVDEMERLGMLGEDEGDQAEGEEERQREGDAIAVRFAEKMRRQLIEPLTSCPVKPVRKSAGEQLEDDRLPWVRRKQADDGEAAEEDDEWGGIED